MHEDELQVFIDGAVNYFTTVTDTAAEVGSPYLVDTPKKLEFTGIIGISGRKKGLVYFTAPRPMLSRLLAFMGEADMNNDNLADMVGEVANTLSGNARKEFGKDFMISVPVVVSGDNENIKVPKGVKSYAIPISWRNHCAFVVISIE